AESADRIYDHLQQQLAKPENHIRPLFDRFNIEILSTTDAAESSLADHAALAAEGWGERVVPTMRPDNLFHPHLPAWRSDIAALAQASQIDVGDYASFLAALRQRRGAFIAA